MLEQELKYSKHTFLGLDLIFTFAYRMTIITCHH